ncbi:hypothetical protein Bca52824_026784 [Brassica carinata]|uniref:At2g35280-like TPR domain-containing protein n=1 Tax=Brassica carinata TaxID=52824 RepID=A0A8X7VA16_BRACI|nr:hypothetical protein Bca52824_026784 [Brassica carinata]
MPSQFLKTCYEEGNPSTIYLKGAQFFFSWCFKEEGFYLLKQAACAGYERDVYLHAITRVIYWSDGEYMSRIPRESVARMGKLVRSVKWGGGLWHCNEFSRRKKCSILLIFRGSIIANVEILLSDHETACGRLIFPKMTACVTAVSTSKSWGASSAIFYP